MRVLTGTSDAASLRALRSLGSLTAAASLRHGKILFLHSGRMRRAFPFCSCAAVWPRTSLLGVAPAMAGAVLELTCSHFQGWGLAATKWRAAGAPTPCKSVYGLLPYCKVSCL